MTDKEMPDNVEELLAQVNGGTAPKLNHTLLEMWRDVLGNIEESEQQKLGFAQSVSLVQRWPDLRIVDVPQLNWMYHENLRVMRQHLLDEIEKDPEAIKHVEDDVDYNRNRYISLLGAWQGQMVRWERDWDRTANDSPLELAAALMAGDFMLGEKGLVAHLDQIGFVLTEEEADELTRVAVEANFDTAREG